MVGVEALHQLAFPVESPLLHLPAQDVGHVLVELEGQGGEDERALAEGGEGVLQVQLGTQVHERAGLREAGLLGVEVGGGGAGEPQESAARKLFHVSAGRGQHALAAELLHETWAVHVEPVGLMDALGRLGVGPVRVAAQVEVGGAVGQAVGEGKALGEGAHQGEELLGSFLGPALLIEECERPERQFECGKGILGALVEESEPPIHIRRPGRYRLMPYLMPYLNS